MTATPLDPLFDLPRARWRDALSCLPAGRLWQVFLPGADPSQALAALGPDGLVSLRAAVLAMSASERSQALAEAGIPFGDPPDPGLIAEVLMADGARTSAGEGVIHTTGTIRHRGRGSWEADVGACVDWAADSLAAGGAPDPLDALVVCPVSDLRSAIPLADADARLRVSEAVRLSGGDPALFRKHYLRRSAISGLMRQIGAVLAPPSSGSSGTDPSGWPLWWKAPRGGAWLPIGTFASADIWSEK